MDNIRHISLTVFNLSLVLTFALAQNTFGAVSTNSDSVNYYEENIDKFAPKRQIEIYENLSKHYSKNNTKKSIDLLYRANKLAVDINDTLKIINTESLLGFVFSNFAKNKNLAFDSARTHYFNALILLDDQHQLNSQEANTQRYKVYLQLGEMYNRTDLNKSYIYFEKALALSDSLSFKYELLLYMHQKVAFITQKIENYQKAILHSLKVIEILDQLGKEKKKISFFNDIGNSYFRMGNYNKALDYYFKELELRRKYNINPLNYDFLDKMASVYIAMEQYGKAMDYYQRALEVLDDNKSLNIKMKNLKTAKYYTRIGLVHYYKKDNLKSLDYYLKALEIIKDLKDKEGLKGKSIIYNNLALNYKAMGRIDNAIESIGQSEKIIEEIGIDSYEFLTLTSMAEIYSSLDKFKEAESYLLKAKEKAKKENINNDLKTSYFLLYELYNKYERFENALNTYQRYKEISDSLLSMSMTNRLAEFQTVYEMEKRNQENEDLKRANKLQKEKARLERQSFFLALLFTLMVVIVLMVLYHFRKRASNVLVVSNNTIEGQNARLLELNDNLRRNEAYLRHSNNAKDKFISIIAHDLKNPMHSIGFSADLMINYYDKLDEDKKMNHLKGIYKTSNHAYDLLENLLHWARAQSKSMNYTPKMIDLGILVKDVVDLSYSSAGNKNISIFNNIPSNTNVYVDKNMIETVTRNLVSNAIKFCNEESTIEISNFQIDENYVISIKDNGVGMSESVLDKIFKIEEQVSTPGTMKESGTGLGLLLCAEFVNINRGHIWAESKLGEGSTFNFTIPMNKKSKMISIEIIQQRLKLV